MNRLLDAALEAGAFMMERRWPFCIIGGLAVQQWGEPRTTLDADMDAVDGVGRGSALCGPRCWTVSRRVFPARALFALERRIVLIRASNGKDVDIALGALPFESGP